MRPEKQKILRGPGPDGQTLFSNYRGLLTATLILALIWVSGVAGVFRAPQGWLYDQMVRVPLPTLAGEPRILLVEVDPSGDLPGQSDWLHLLEMLQGLGAAKVVFGFLPETASPAFYRLAAASDSAVFGRSVTVSEASQQLRLEPWPDAARGRPLAFGAVAIPPAEAGVHRRAVTGLHTVDGVVPTLEVAAAGADVGGGGTDAGLGTSFLVNFNHGRDWLPRVSVERVLRGGLIAQLVEGRTVLVGRKAAPAEPGLHTPLDAAGGVLTLLEYQGYTLDTLLGERRIHEPSAAVTLLLLAMIGLAGFVTYQWIGLVVGSWLTAAMVPVYFALGWVLVHVLRVSIPVVELILAQAALFWIFIRFRLVSDQQRIRGAVLARAARLRHHVSPPGFNHLEEPWEQLAALVDQLLELERFVFLEKVPGDHRVREVMASRCTLDDIETPERDYGREPYRSAIDEGAAVRLEGKPFLKCRGEEPEEAQYVVPLVFEGELQGFWAFSVDSTAVDAPDRFLAAVGETALEVARLLHSRTRFAAQRENDKGLLRRLFRLEAWTGVYREVEQTLGTCGHQLQATRAIFDSIGTAAVAYDLFGRVVQVNTSMEQFMRDTGLRGYDMNALELLVSFSGLPAEEVRPMLRQVVTDRSELRVPAARQTTDGEWFSVTVRPIVATDAALSESGSAVPFQLIGILCEFVNITQVARLLRPKEQMLERIQWRLQNSLQALSTAGYLLRQSTGADQRGGETAGEGRRVSGSAEVFPAATQPTGRDDLWLAGIIDDKVADIRSALGELGPTLDEEASGPEPVHRPSDAQAALAKAIEALKPEADARGISIDIRQPAVASLVKAHPEQLDQLFKVLLKSLVSDARAETRVVVEVVERDGFVVHHFRNEGFGIPDERFQAYLTDSVCPIAGEFLQLREAIGPVSGWGGDIEMHSQVDVGTWGHLRLLAAS